MPPIDPPSAAADAPAPRRRAGRRSAHEVPPADPRRFKALAVIAIAQLMIVLDASIVNLAIPSASADLQIAPADVQWIVTAYTLTFGGFLLLGGRIADYWGRKRTFIVGLGGFALASLIGGLAPNLGLLIAARALQGGFAALLAPAALALISVSFHDPKERAKAFGVIGAISGGRRGHRPAARRRADRVLLVALVPGGQHPDRDRDRCCSRATWSRSPAPAATPATTSPARSPRPWAWSRWSTGSPRQPPRATRTPRTGPSRAPSSGSSPRRSCSARSW